MKDFGFVKSRSPKVLHGVRGGSFNPLSKTHWTRAKVAEFCGVSKTAIILWEQNGHLKATIDEHGVHWFLIADVQRLPVREKSTGGRPGATEGDIEARILTLIEKGSSLTTIVKELHVPIRKVREVYRESQYELDDVVPRQNASADLKTKLSAKLELERIRLETERVRADAQKTLSDNRRLSKSVRLATKRESSPPSNAKDPDPSHD